MNVTELVKLYLDNERDFYELSRNITRFHNKEDIEGLAFELENTFFYMSSNFTDNSKLVIKLLDDLKSQINWFDIAHQLVNEIQENKKILN